MNKALLGLLLTLITTNIHAGGLLGFAPSPAELVMLPDYCKAKDAGPESPEFQAWVMRLGPKFERTWGGMHHVCSGINQTNRYLRLINDPKRGYYLSRAVPEIDYIAAHTPDDFPLAGDILMHRGHAYMLMKKNAQASADFLKSISLDSKQTQSYLYLAEIYVELGEKGKALEIVTSGLKAVSSSKALKKKYLSLGGKEPFPEPDTPVSASPDQELRKAADSKAMASDVQPPPTGESRNAAPVRAVTVSGNQESQGKDNKENTPEKSEKPVIGTEKNPYCRFCP